MNPAREFEQHLLVSLQRSRIGQVEVKTNSTDELDFAIILPDMGFTFQLDAKVKSQRYNLSNWPGVSVPQDHFFILDDLAWRKVLIDGMYGGFAIKDIPGNKYVFISQLDLGCMPFKRFNRRINRNRPELKGKRAIDLRNGKCSSSIDEMIRAIRHYIYNVEESARHDLPCYGNYYGETIESGGIQRIPEHWEKDVT